MARGNTPLLAEKTATMISFPVKQSDSILTLPKGFGISKESKFRNQQVLVNIEVPVGKFIRIDKSIDWYSWFNLNVNKGGLNMDFDDDFYNDYSWSKDVWYVMTEKGLERVDKKDKNSNDKDESENNKDWNTDENKNGGEYRYRKNGDTIDIKIKKNDTTVNIKLNTEIQPKESDEETETSVTLHKKEKSTQSKQVLISVLDLLKVGS
jgi:hypothetical protein